MRTLLLTLTAGLLLSACGTRGLPYASPYLSDDAVVLDLPVVKQHEADQCGLAVATALARYHGHELTAEQQQRLRKLAEENDGNSVRELETAFQELGLRTQAFIGTFDDSPTGVFNFVNKRLPLLITLPGSGGGYHYVLVMGYDPDRETVVLLEPTRGQVVLPNVAFHKSWQEADCLAVLAWQPVSATERDETNRTGGE